MRRSRLVLCLTLFASACAAAAPRPPSAAPAQWIRPAAPAPPGPLESDDPELRACESGKLWRCHIAAENLRGQDSDPGLPARVFARWRAGCERDVAADCFRAAQLAGDLARSVSFLSRACRLDLLEGCHSLASRYRMKADEGHPDLARRADALDRSSCERGLGDACTALADLIEWGEPTPADRARALALYQRGCTLGDQDACELAFRLGCELDAHADCDPEEDGGAVIGGVVGGPVAPELVGELPSPLPEP